MGVHKFHFFFFREKRNRINPISRPMIEETVMSAAGDSRLNSSAE